MIQRYADKAYRDDNISYFSVLAMHMSEDAQDKWLSKALEDEKWSFQSMLFNALNREDEFDELKESWEKEWEEAQAAEYRAVGVTINGKDYYYQGQLVDIFLDIRPGKAFYTLNMNPAGIVNIKIIRDEGNRITGVAYMTDAEVAELLEDHDEEDDGDGYGDRDDETGHDRDGDAQDDWNDDEDEEDDGDSGWDDDSDDDSNGRQRAAGGRTWYPQVIPVDLETIAEGQVVYLGSTPCPRVTGFGMPSRRRRETVCKWASPKLGTNLWKPSIGLCRIDVRKTKTWNASPALPFALRQSPEPISCSSGRWTGIWVM